MLTWKCQELGEHVDLIEDVFKDENYHRKRLIIGLGKGVQNEYADRITLMLDKSVNKCADVFDWAALQDSNVLCKRIDKHFAAEKRLARLQEQ